MERDPVVLVQPLRRLRGSSNPVLVRASDGHNYIVKLAKNAQQANLLFNEAAGSELYLWLGLPTPAWQPLVVTRRFLKKHPGFWLEDDLPEGRQRALCFGSRYLGGPNTRLFEVLPSVSLRRIRNASDFWLAWLVDLCADHADNRQCLFQEEAQGGLRATFVDHGHMFGGPNGELVPHFCTARYLDERIYPRIGEQFILSLGQALLNSNLEEIWRRIQAIPEEWSTRSGRSTLADCLQKLASASSLHQMLTLLLDFRSQLLERDSNHTRTRRPAEVLRVGVQAPCY